MPTHGLSFLGISTVVIGINDKKKKKIDMVLTQLKGYQKSHLIQNFIQVCQKCVKRWNNVYPRKLQYYLILTERRGGCSDLSFYQFSLVERASQYLIAIYINLHNSVYVKYADFCQEDYQVWLKSNLVYIHQDPINDVTGKGIAPKCLMCPATYKPR